MSIKKCIVFDVCQNFFFFVANFISISVCGRSRHRLALLFYCNHESFLRGLRLSKKESHQPSVCLQVLECSSVFGRQWQCEKAFSLPCHTFCREQDSSRCFFLSLIQMWWRTKKTVLCRSFLRSAVYIMTCKVCLRRKETYDCVFDGSLLAFDVRASLSALFTGTKHKLHLCQTGYIACTDNKLSIICFDLQSFSKCTEVSQQNFHDTVVLWKSNRVRNSKNI